ncbi:hypothetical protein [Spiroplasma endosymbiont of Cantharis lateralis]|uniref:hypothetical protein n=1 Tax=Spiroplasma endosymbiont of Cantharis lateralis TaxID=3066277 RepID=UPI00313D1BBE
MHTKKLKKYQKFKTNAFIQNNYKLHVKKLEIRINYYLTKWSLIKKYFNSKSKQKNKRNIHKNLNVVKKILNAESTWRNNYKKQSSHCTNKNMKLEDVYKIAAWNYQLIQKNKVASAYFN